MSDTATQDFDLSQFEAAESGVLEVMNAKGEPLLYKGQPVTIELYSPGSTQFVRAQAKLEQANQVRSFAAIRGKANPNGPEEQRKDIVTKLAACTKSVNNFPIPGGAAALYGNAKLGYITEQVSKFLEDWANFPPASSTT